MSEMSESQKDSFNISERDEDSDINNRETVAFKAQKGLKSIGYDKGIDLHRVRFDSEVEVENLRVSMNDSESEMNGAENVEATLRHLEKKPVIE